MLIYRVEDLFEKAAQCQKLSREQEKDCALAMSRGEEEGRRMLIESYLPMVAGYIRRQKPELQTLSLALGCVNALEKCVTSFNFLQDGEPFIHRLSWALRNELTKEIAK